MKNISCCYTGHRDIPQREIPVVYKKVRAETEKLILGGTRHFYTGGAMGFDMLALKAVVELKQKYPHIVLHLIIPCADHTKHWNESIKKEFSGLKEYADEVKCLSPFYFGGCMQVRNRYLADHSSVCIAYLNRETGGSAYTVKYAAEKGLTVINIASENI